MNKNVDIVINGVQIYKNNPKEDEHQMYSLSDICRAFFPNDEPARRINSWLRSQNVLENIGGWERKNNPNFNQHEIVLIISESGDNTFNISVSQLVERTNAISIKTTRGPRAGCHAVEFVIKKFITDIRPDMSAAIDEQISKRDQLAGLREVCKLGYRALMETVKENLIDGKDLDSNQSTRIYAREADALNIAIFGMRHSEWKRLNPNTPKGNQRDYASAPTLYILNQMEMFAVSYIRLWKTYDERLVLYFRDVEYIKRSVAFKDYLKNNGFDPDKEYPLYIDSEIIDQGCLDIDVETDEPSE